MNIPDNDTELFDLMESQLYSAVIGDVMDAMGLFHQFLPYGLHPIREDMKLVGRAMPVLEADTFGLDAPGSANPMFSKPFGLMLEALDDLKPGEIYVATGASPHYALFGELMSTRAKILGARGALVDGPARDIDGIRDLEFPLFCKGYYAQDQGPRGKVVNYRCPIEIAGIRIDPGALIFGDKEGVLIIPLAHEKEVIKAALEKAAGEKTVGEAIAGGLSAVESWDRYGIM